MALNSDQVITIAVAFAAPLFLAGINQMFSASTERRKRRSQIIAEAHRSVMKRVELCYRILRRVDGDKDDEKGIRDVAHSIQEENEYYRGLLLSESFWLGFRYSQYIVAVRRLTAEPMRRAWEKKGDPAANGTVLALDHEQIVKLSNQFMADARRFSNPVLRIWMGFRNWRLQRLKKKVGGYGSD